MAYWITRFGTVDIEDCTPMQDVGLPFGQSGAVPTVGGGAFDGHGSARALRPVPWELRIQAELVRTTQPAMLSAWRTLLALHGERATLYRTPDGGTPNSEWVTARLLGLPASRQAEHVLYLPFEMDFEVWSPCWNGTAHDETTTLDASPKTVTLANGGNVRVVNPILTLTAGSADITAVEIAVAGTSKWTYSGTIVAGTPLVVDCGSWSVLNNGSDAYGDFELDATDHVIEDLLRLEPGNTSLDVTLTGGGVDSTLRAQYADGWA